VLVQGGVAGAGCRPGSSRTNLRAYDLLPERFSPVPSEHGERNKTCCGLGVGFVDCLVLDLLFALPRVVLAGEGGGAAHSLAAARWLFLVALVWVVQPLCQPAPHHPSARKRWCSLQPWPWPSSGRGTLRALMAARHWRGLGVFTRRQRADAGLSVRCLLTEAAGRLSRRARCPDPSGSRQ